MAKIIKMTDEILDAAREEFYAAIKKMKLSDGKITYTKSLGTIDRKATLSFTEMAYWKMITLVSNFDKEVAWHGIAKRGEEPDEYIISDILVYPQEVTGATVNTDQEKYQMWLMQHDDEVFNNIRMQGHSHVNMGVTPSGVDTSLYDRILEQLEDDMFYVFLIWNKRNERHIKIYDLAKNVLFETADVTVNIIDDGSGIQKFLQDARNMVQDKKYYTPTQPTTTPISTGYNSYSSWKNPSANTQPATPTTPAVKGKEVKFGGKKKSSASTISTDKYKDYDDYDDTYDVYGYGGYRRYY